MHSFLRLLNSFQCIPFIADATATVTAPVTISVIVMTMTMMMMNKKNKKVVNVIPNAKKGIGRIRKRYTILNVIGRGCFGTVRKIQDKKTKQFFACKTISKKDPEAIPYYLIRREVECLRQVRYHPHLIQLHDIYEENDFVHIITELCTGGELYHRIVTPLSSNSTATTTKTTTTTTSSWDITQEEVAQLLYNITHAIAYCHEQGYVHRDLKAPNFMFTNSGTNTDIKIIDFGLAKCFLPQPSDIDNDNDTMDDNENKTWLLKSKVGTPYYVAPEVLIDDIYLSLIHI